METFALYLIKSSVWLTGFSLIYILFLRNERFFVLNRIYLVSGILVSIIFPLFTWHYTVIFPVTPTAEVLEPQVVGVTPVSESFPIQNLLLYFYLTGALYLLFRLIKQTVAVWRVIRQSETQHFNSIKLIRTDRYPASFSFFSFVFVNPSIDEPETSEIVNHEQEHIRQQHWMDLLLFEILRTMHWFNPVSWLYGRMIRQNHEYLADERALQRSSNPAIYRAALLNQMFGGPVISLANSFNYSLNKKRFNMMKQITYSPFRKLKLLLVLPLIAGVFYAFATPEYQFVQANTNDQITQPQSQMADITIPTNTIQEKIVKGKITDEQGNPLKNASIVVSETTLGTVSDASGNFEIKMTDESPIVFSYVGFTSQKVKPDFAKEMKITMKRVVISIDAVGNKPSDSEIFRTSGPVLTFVDGKEVSEEEQKNIDPKQIESVSVLRKKEFTDKYGEKGKNGVILITLKNDDPTKTIKLQSNSPLNFGDEKIFGMQPLIIVDGVGSKPQNANNIPPEKIESITILKDESATKIYGDKGKNGVILITTKKSPSIKFSAKEAEFSDKEGLIINEPQELNIKSENGKQPLIVIDGTIIENKNLEDIDPETIQSMSVLKDEKAIEKYGDQGKNGVVEITLKKENEVFVIVEQMPEFPGGVKALQEYVRVNLQYPKIAFENRIQGQVKVGFVVSKTGSIEDVKIISNVDPSLGEEAVRIIRSMPKWSPGVQQGQNVDVSYEIPVNFKLPADYHPKSKEKLREKK